MLKFGTTLLLVSLAASAADAATISVWLSGTAFEGGPSFKLELGTQEIGVGTVDPIPTDAAGTRFDFQVSDSLLLSGAPLRIQLTNDRYEKGKGDRNLFVVAAQVGDVRLGSANFVVHEPNGSSGRVGELYGNDEVAIATPPKGSWVVAQATKAPSDKAQPVPECNATVTFTVFSVNAVTPDLSVAPDVAPLLQQAKGNCSVIVTGYSSMSGPAEWNKTLAGQRATAVLDFLLAQGAKFRSQEVTAFGATDQFGPSESANRRVVVRLVK